MTKKMAKKSSRKPAKKRATNIREAIVRALQKRSLTREDLFANLGASMASIDAHLKTLRDERVVKATGTRPKMFEIALGSPEQRTRPAARERDEDVTIPPELERALNQISQRVNRDAVLESAARKPLKIVTLEILAEAMPGPVAEILLEIRDDYTG